MIFFSIEYWTTTISFPLLLRIYLSNFSFIPIKALFLLFSMKRHGALPSEHECFEIELRKEKNLFCFGRIPLKCSNT